VEREERLLSDIFAGQPTDAKRLAEFYDLEHDEVEEDRVFYRELTRRSRGSVLDLGCGSGRLFAAFLDGGARRIVGLDGSPALLRRAEARIAADRRLATAATEGRIELVEGDVRRVRRPDRFGLVVLAGVLAHLDGPEDALRTLAEVRRLLTESGRAVIDGVGPGGLPGTDLPLSVDWRRVVDGRQVIRRSQLVRHEAPEGLRVLFSTIVDAVQRDGTIARLPASFRLWYPSPTQVIEIAEKAGLSVEMTYGSHDLEPLGDESARCIVLARRTTGTGRRSGARVEAR
jgi:SAM-dependent methyltransferase